MVSRLVRRGKRRSSWSVCPCRDGRNERVVSFSTDSCSSSYDARCMKAVGKKGSEGRVFLSLAGVGA